MRKGTPVNYERYDVLESKFRNLFKAKKRGYWRTFVNGLSRETAMSTLWNPAKRLRIRNVTNESVEYSHRWIFDFARKVCPVSVRAQKIVRDASAGNNTMDSPITITEFSLALFSCNNNAPGPDRINHNSYRPIAMLSCIRKLSFIV